MKTFWKSVALAALSGYTSVEANSCLTTCTAFANTDLNTPDPTICAEYGGKVTALLSCLGLRWSPYEVTGSGGYQTRMVRILQNENVVDKGAIFLMHGATVDGFMFAAGGMQDSKVPPLLVQLHDAGYDIYLGFPRGGFLNKGHTTLDPNSSAYWNFTAENVGKEDITAAISEIVDIRHNENRACIKTQIIAHSLGAVQVMFAMTRNACTAKSVVDRIVNFTPCAVPLRSYFVPTERDRLRELQDEEDSDDSDDSDGRRELQKWSELTEEQRMWRRIKRERNKIRKQLKVQDNRAEAYVTSDGDEAYNLFYNAWRQYIKDQPAAFEADPLGTLLPIANIYLAETAPYFDDMTSITYSSIISLLALKGTQKEYDTVYGPDWATQIGTIEAVEFAKTQATVLTDVMKRRAACLSASDYPTCHPETSIIAVAESAQRAFTQKFTAYSPTFFEDRVEGEEFEFSTVDIPIVNNYVKDDETCDDAVNRPIFDRNSSTVRSTTWIDEKTHGGPGTIVFFEDQESIETLFAQLRVNADRTISGDWCDDGMLDWDKEWGDNCSDK